MTYTLQGKIISGQRLGGRLGFPTANLEVNPDFGARNGVWAVTVRFRGKTLYGMANLGARPTVTDSLQRMLEVHIFDFGEDLYGEPIEVELIQYIREEKKFSDIKALREQIEKDYETIKNLFPHADGKEPSL